MAHSDDGWFWSESIAIGVLIGLLVGVVLMLKSEPGLFLSAVYLSSRAALFIGNFR